MEGLGLPLTYLAQFDKSLQNFLTGSDERRVLVLVQISALVREHVAVLDGMVEQLPRVLAKEVFGVTMPRFSRYSVTSVVAARRL